MDELDQKVYGGKRVSREAMAGKIGVDESDEEVESYDDEDEDMEDEDDDEEMEEGESMDDDKDEEIDS